MKIGLIGINRYAAFLNFACNLHAYAFQQYLKSQGYDATFLDYKPIHYDGHNLREPAKFAESRYRSIISETASSPAADKARSAAARRWAELAMGYRALTEERKTRYDKFEAFVADNLDFTTEKYDPDLLEVQDPDMDCYICVTDVIWQPMGPTPAFDRGFMLGSKAFEGKPKIAYAPSRGAQPDFKPGIAEEFFEYLEDIDSISVRERDFGQYIEEHTGRSIPTVIDPVLLHDKAFWDRVEVPPKEEKYLLLYYVMERSTDTVTKAVEYAKAHDLTIVELSDRPLPHGKITDPEVRHIPRYDVSAEEWLGYIAHADAVFTNSFHGCCFSLIFETLFFVGKRDGNKVPNFLAEFGLSDQQFSPEDDVDSFGSTVDFVQAKARLQERRKSSEDFLLAALQKAAKSGEASPAADDSRYDARRRQLTYPAHFHSGAMINSEDKGAVKIEKSQLTDLKIKNLKSGALEYTGPSTVYRNDGGSRIEPVQFRTSTHRFMGWTLRFRIDKRWFWLLDDGTIAPGDTKGSDLDDRKRVFEDGALIPHLPVNSIASVVFVARWEKTNSVDTKPSVTSTLSRLKDRLKPR